MVCCTWLILRKAADLGLECFNDDPDKSDVKTLPALFPNFNMENEFLHFVIVSLHGFKSFYPNHYPIPLTLGIRQAQRYTTSLQVDFAT